MHIEQPKKYNISFLENFTFLNIKQVILRKCKKGRRGKPICCLFDLLEENAFHCIFESAEFPLQRIICIHIICVLCVEKSKY